MGEEQPSKEKTTLLEEKEVGQPIKIERIEDTPSGKEHPYHNFKIYSPKEGRGSD